MKQLVNVLTEKGYLKTEAASQIKAQVVAKLENNGFKQMPNGRLTLPIGECDGHTIYANLDVSIGVDTCFAKKTKNQDPVTIGDLDL